MKTDQLSLALRKFYLSGETPEWVNEKYLYVRLHTDNPSNVTDATPQYNGYKPVRIARSSLTHDLSASVISENVQFAANRDKGSLITLKYFTISIGEAFMAHKEEIPDGGMTLTSGHVPYFESGTLRILEK